MWSEFICLDSYLIEHMTDKTITKINLRQSLLISMMMMIRIPIGYAISRKRKMCVQYQIRNSRWAETILRVFYGISEGDVCGSVPGIHQTAWLTTCGMQMTPVSWYLILVPVMRQRRQMGSNLSVWETVMGKCHGMWVGGIGPQTNLVWPGTFILHTTIKEHVLVGH